MACLRDSIVLWALGGGLALLGGCGDDSGTSGSEGSSSSSGAATGETGAVSTGPSDTDPVATGGGSGGSSSEGGDTTAGGGETTAGDTTMGGSTSEGETEGNACADLDMRACMADRACMGVGGRELIMGGGAPCLGPRTFIECQPATGCGDAITYACEAEDGPLWEFGSTCIPTGWMECGPPPPIELLPCEDAGG